MWLILVGLGAYIVYQGGILFPLADNRWERALAIGAIVLGAAFAFLGAGWGALEAGAGR